MVLATVGLAPAHANAAADAPSGAPAAATSRVLRLVVVDAAGGRTTGNLTTARNAKGQDRAVVRRFTEDEMRRGRLVATDDLSVAAVALPDGVGTLRTVVEGTPRHVEFIARPPSPGDPTNETGFGAIVVDDDDQTAQDSIGLASDAVVSTNGMTKQGGGCRTVWFDSVFSSTDHKVVTCYEKWKDVGTRNWVYNRWALADQAAGGIVDFTIRSRPWSGTGGRIDTLDNWTPKPSQSCSNGASATLGYGGASVTIPYIYCSSAIEIYPDSNANSMGVGWYGNTTNQLQIDFAMAARTYTASQELTYADYVWLSVVYCGAGPCKRDDEKYADPGW